MERIRDGHPSTLGASSGAIAALVAITPSCGAVTPLAALAIGGAAGAVCHSAVSLKSKLGFDDASTSLQCTSLAASSAVS
ncbi:hypothetical protein [Arthrobacter sp. MW3 TE3886]|uniref:hypothetical protein n=1 Tax=Arthrobacter sp. MW3 TE3886 TaxID=3156254 RepID=UPI003515B321